MNIHEYQAKELLARYGAPVPPGHMAESPVGAELAAKTLGGDVWMVKAQIHAGGRGLAGGIRKAQSTAEVYEIAANLLGTRLVTAQNAPAGSPVRRLLIEPAIPHVAEYYLAVALDRNLETPVILASSSGGVEIERISDENPSGMVRLPVDPLIGFRPFHSRRLASALNLPAEAIPAFSRVAAALYRLYRKTDASLVEVNPLALLEDHTFLALDAKVTIDDNALFRRPDILAMQDPEQEDPSELEARRYNLSYVKLAGNVGCMVNGAGLALATMDLIRLEGGAPANFLDVGGGANAATVAKGFEIILLDRCVKVIFVNIFGGIVRCDRIAGGVIEAAKRIGLTIPIVVRLDGVNAAEAMEMLNEAGLPNLVSVPSLADGAKLSASVTDLECCR
jgi:succinyl-CoA synthetase beta subunit